MKTTYDDKGENIAGNAGIGPEFPSTRTYAGKEGGGEGGRQEGGREI